MNEARKIRVAFAEPSDGVIEVAVEDIEALLGDSVRMKREAYRDAEYVDLDSPHVTWEAIRKHGCTCRAFLPWRTK